MKRLTIGLIAILVALGFMEVIGLITISLFPDFLDFPALILGMLVTLNGGLLLRMAYLIGEEVMRRLK